MVEQKRRINILADGCQRFGLVRAYVAPRRIVKPRLQAPPVQRFEKMPEMDKPLSSLELERVKPAVIAPISHPVVRRIIIVPHALCAVAVTEQPAQKGFISGAERLPRIAPKLFVPGLIAQSRLENAVKIPQIRGVVQRVFLRLQAEPAMIGLVVPGGVMGGEEAVVGSVSG